MLYLVSDIHGNRKVFDEVLNKVNFNANDHLYILGDIIDRHPYGIHLLLRIMNMKNVTMLLGNHELMMLNALGYQYADEKIPEDALYIWYQNGGIVTKKVFDALNENTQNRVINYLKSLPLNIDLTVNDKKIKLVHAAPINIYEADETFKEVNETPLEFAVWDRSLLVVLPDIEGTDIVVLGHTITYNYERKGDSYMIPRELISVNGVTKYIDIDTGSGFPDKGYRGFYGERLLGCVTCVQINDDASFTYYQSCQDIILEK